MLWLILLSIQLHRQVLSIATSADCECSKGCNGEKLEVFSSEILYNGTFSGFKIEMGDRCYVEKPEIQEFTICFKMNQHYSDFPNSVIPVGVFTKIPQKCQVRIYLDGQVSNDSIRIMTGPFGQGNHTSIAINKRKTILKQFQRKYTKIPITAKVLISCDDDRKENHLNWTGNFKFCLLPINHSPPRASIVDDRRNSDWLRVGNRFTRTMPENIQKALTWKTYELFVFLNSYKGESESVINYRVKSIECRPEWLTSECDLHIWRYPCRFVTTPFGHIRNWDSYDETQLIVYQLQPLSYEDRSSFEIECVIEDDCDLPECNSFTNITIVINLIDVAEPAHLTTSQLNKSIRAGKEIRGLDICGIELADLDLPGSKYFTLNTVAFNQVESECTRCSPNLNVRLSPRGVNFPAYRVTLELDGIFSPECVATHSECIITFQLVDSTETSYDGNCSISVFLVTTDSSTEITTSGGSNYCF